MSMIGEYLRLTPAELDRAVKDPDWAFELAEAAMDEDELPPAEARQFSTHQAWHLLDFLLRRGGFPVDVVMGEELLADAADWGYDPPKYLTPERVQVAAAAFRDLSYDDVIRGVDPAELAAAQIYPRIWDSPDSLEWARDSFAELTEFFQAAAGHGNAIVAWIS